MSDTAIFITIANDELTSKGQLPGELRGLKSMVDSDERVVHSEVLADAPLPEKTLHSLHMAGAILNILPSATDTTAALVGGLMARLHEFICAYPHVSQFVLAGANVDRLASAAFFLQRAGFYVIVAGPERPRLDAVRAVCDDVQIWSSSGRQSSSSSRDRDNGGRESSSRSRLDPYEVLVEEVSKGREKGNRVLLTSLKQRMRRRMRRFDETRLKDKDGRPMRKFKDFILDAVNRDLIQLVEKGNASHVLLPNEEIPDDEEEDTKDSKNNNDNEDENVDPLLDSVDMADDDEKKGKGGKPKDLKELKEDMFTVDEVDEEADAPPAEFIEFLQSLIPEEGLTLSGILSQISQKKEKGDLDSTNKELRDQLQNTFYNELLEPVSEDTPTRYVVVDDWKDIIDFL